LTVKIRQAVQSFRAGAESLWKSGRQFAPNFIFLWQPCADQRTQCWRSRECDIANSKTTARCNPTVYRIASSKSEIGRELII